MVVDALASKAQEPPVDQFLLIGLFSCRNGYYGYNYDPYQSGASSSNLTLHRYCNKTKAIVLDKKFVLISSLSESGAIVANKNLYFIGRTSKKINLKNFEMTSLPDPNTKRTEFGIASLNGFIYVIGGSYLETVER